jgi:hypothetical protein
MLGTLGTGISGLKKSSNNLCGGISYATRPCGGPWSGMECVSCGSWANVFRGGASNIRLNGSWGSVTDQRSFG